jgi:uncharacterized protein YciI
MATFMLACFDKAQSLPLRMATRQAHLAYMADKGPMLKLAGPLLDEAGDMTGSLLLIEADDLAAATAFSAADPYTQAGLWDRVEIKAFRASIGQL